MTLVLHELDAWFPSDETSHTCDFAARLALLRLGVVGALALLPLDRLGDALLNHVVRAPPIVDLLWYSRVDSAVGLHLGVVVDFRLEAVKLAGRDE